MDLCNMLKKSLLVTLFLVTQSAYAGLMTGTGSYTMTGFQSAVGSSASSATSLNSDVVNFTDMGGSPLSMMVADNSTQSWWSGSSDPFYYANLNTNWVELVMPANTLAFSLSIDASVSAKAWIVGVADDGSAINTNGQTFSLLTDGSFNPIPGFNIPLSGPVQTFGFHASNTAASCNTISKVVVDPHYWGMGDFAIHVDDKACSSKVPEPSVIALFAAGLFGLGLALRRKS